MTRLHFSRKVFLSASLALACVAATHAQSNTGTILGTVQDDTGAAIPGASIVIRNLGTGETRTVTSDASGVYNVPNLQIGHYSVTISHDGFTSTQIADTELQVAQRSTINPTLHVGAISDKVEVIASQTPLLNEASSAVGQVIDTQTVQNVPLNGRNFWQLTQLTPGVSFIQGGQNIAAGGTS
ncbi:MAG: carboxypeptidase-like regulatory domain-containing protein, partial [Terriglobus sp.]